MISTIISEPRGALSIDNIPFSHRSVTIASDNVAIPKKNAVITSGIPKKRQLMMIIPSMTHNGHVILIDSFMIQFILTNYDFVIFVHFKNDCTRRF